jgi:hypothetical protein
LGRSKSEHQKKEGKMKTLTKKEIKNQAQEEAKARILELLDTGAERPTIYTILRKVSSSGMSRQISLKVIKEGVLYDITYSTAILLDLPLVEGFNRAIRVNGCGMDMGFDLVYGISSRLFAGQERAGYTIRHEWA